jgi:hypothetical protein
MKHFFIFPVIIMSFCLGMIQSSCTKKKQLIEAITYSEVIETYEPLFISFDVMDPVQNPFDQKQIQVDLEITAPNAKSFILPCYYTQEESNPNQWQARFTPQQTGEYTFKIKIQKNNKTHYSERQNFTSGPPSGQSHRKGLLTYDKSNPLYLEYANGENFKGLGLNVGWVFEPKWNNPDKYTYEMFFSELHENDANFIRMWICPWNLPIEWTPVPTYEMLFDDFENWDQTLDNSAGLKLDEGHSKECQSDIGQLIKNSSTDEHLIYEVDDPKIFKLMLYHKGNLSTDDFELSYSTDNINYTSVDTKFSDSWNAYEDWKRVFLFSYELDGKNARYVKLKLKNSLVPENIKLAGIQIRHGDPVTVLDCNGLNHYSYKNSQKLDDLIKLSEKYGIKILITLGYHGVFNPIMDSWGANDEWQRNPYNQKNGGPCAQPADFFSNSDAKAAYKNYLRYFVARWGYSDVVAGWELWNEIDLAQKSQNIPVEDIILWHEEMSDYLKSIDPYNHLVTTSLSGNEFDKIWEAESIDITQIHQYRPTDDFVSFTNEMVEKFKKPHLIGEYAVDWKGPGFGYTEEEYEEAFRDGMWRGLFTESPILPLSWWWEFHLDNGHYRYFKPLGIVINEIKSLRNPISILKLPQPKGYQVLGLSSSKTILVWIKKMEPNNLNEIQINLDHEGPFKYSSFNTSTGISSEEKTTQLDDGIFRVNSQMLSHDEDVLMILRKQL